jgi:hypothetical protein
MYKLSRTEHYDTSVPTHREVIGVSESEGRPSTRTWTREEIGCNGKKTRGCRSRSAITSIQPEVRRCQARTGVEGQHRRVRVHAVRVEDHRVRERRENGRGQVLRERVIVWAGFVSETYADRSMSVRTSCIALLQYAQAKYVPCESCVKAPHASDTMFWAGSR